MRISTDRQRCIGAGQCVLAAPALFDQGEEDGLVELLDPAPPEPQWPAAREAAALCPSATIAVAED